MNNSDSDNSLTSRQDRLAIPLILPPKGVAVVGCGGVGSWTAKLLALAGVKTIYLFDADVVETHNLSRLPLPLSTVGQTKSRALAFELRRLRPEGEFIPFGNFSRNMAGALTLDKEIDWLICTTDTLASRVLCHEWCKERGINYIEGSAEGDLGGMAGIPAEWATPEEELPGYQSVPVWCGPSVAAAYLTVTHVLHGITPGDSAISMGVVRDSEGNREFQMDKLEYED